jgi:UDP-N-acetylmuramoylalanine--D-glutamate ligase
MSDLGPARRALVVGLGRSGRAAALLLARLGYETIGVDAAPVAAPELERAGVRVIAPSTEPVPGVDVVVKSPGVPGDVPAVAAARAAGAAVWSEVELAARNLANPVIAVTGTNGKTTTTELTAHLLNVAGVAAVACGNQGTPISGLVGAVDPGAWLVVECSSFQLEDTDTFHPRAAVLLNVAPDHLDRHGGFDEYVAAKLRAFARQEPEDLAILPRGLAHPGRAPARHLDEGPPGEGAIAWSEGGLHLAGDGFVAAWGETALRGRHNRQNAMAAAALARHAGAPATAIAEGLASFPGVPHRLEQVAEVGGVRYVNDSKATNPDAAEAALDAYPERVHLIAGGRGKGTSFAALARAARGAVERAYLIGETAGDLAAALAAEGVPHESPGTLEAAVAAAAARARPGDVVLLAPACASYDQFRDFEERGAAFRAAVAALPRDGVERTGSGVAPAK